MGNFSITYRGIAQKVDTLCSVRIHSLECATTYTIWQCCLPHAYIYFMALSCNEFLRIVAALKDSAVGEQLIADYLLYILNKSQRFEYVDYMKVEEPTDNIRLLLAKSAIAQGFLIKVKNYEKGLAPKIIRLFVFYIESPL